jgi:hypothetical protein
MDPNYDPLDETNIRPQVGFRLREGSYDYHEFANSLSERFLNYYDILLFGSENGEVPGAVRFKWDTPSAVVDSATEWLRSQSYVLTVNPTYGGPIGAA